MVDATNLRFVWIYLRADAGSHALIRRRNLSTLNTLRPLVMMLRLLAAALLLTPAGVWAQWPDYKTPGAPRTADGKVDLSGPAPKTADGKPDFSGVWLQASRAAAGAAPAPTPPALAASTPTPSANRDIIPLSVRQSQFWNLGAAFKDGLP